MDFRPPLAAPAWKLNLNSGIVMPMKPSPFPRLASSVAAVFLAVALDGCALQEALNQKTLAQTEAENVAAEKADAESGNAWSQFNYGEYLVIDKSDYATAHYWFMKSAQSGNPHGEEALAVDYVLGRGGVAKDDALAASWMQKAAAQGGASAQYSLAQMYGDGRGVPKDRAKQIELLEKSGEQFNKDALHELTRLGDPHGVARRMYAGMDAADAEDARERNAQMQQRNSQPAEQPMCSVNNGQVTYLAPC